MRTYKIIDIVVQLLLLLLILVFFIGALGFSVLHVVILLGIVQLLSTAIHLVAPQFKNSRLRKIYYWLLLVAFIWATVIMAITSETGWDELSVLALFLFYTLGMAVFYWIICFRELRSMKKDETSTRIN